VIGGVALAVTLICLLLTARSLRSIADAQSPLTTLYDQSSPMPVTRTFDRPSPTIPFVRVAVIGGMTFTGFWGDLAKRYELQHGVHIQLISTGEKNDIASAFKRGDIDVITMHASDTIINLVADGYAMDPQPWMRNDLVIVGPPADPAGIRGMADAAAALRKIALAKASFVVHSSLGAQEVLLNIMEPNQITLDPAHTTVMFDDQQRSVLTLAGNLRAYTLVGRIPFRTGRLPNNGLVMMVQGDPRLCRPYIVAVANPALAGGHHLADARKFAASLRSPDTQHWIASYGKGLIDDRPLFFPVTVAEPSTEPAP
jgi:tungstate transport system substrate-binding protein